MYNGEYIFDDGYVVNDSMNNKTAAARNQSEDQLKVELRKEIEVLIDNIIELKKKELEKYKVELDEELRGRLNDILDLDQLNKLKEEQEKYKGELEEDLMQTRQKNIDHIASLLELEDSELDEEGPEELRKLQKELSNKYLGTKSLVELEYEDLAKMLKEFDQELKELYDKYGNRNLKKESEEKSWQEDMHHKWTKVQEELERLLEKLKKDQLDLAEVTHNIQRLFEYYNQRYNAMLRELDNKYDSWKKEVQEKYDYLKREVERELEKKYDQLKKSGLQENWKNNLYSLLVKVDCEYQDLVVAYQDLIQKVQQTESEVQQTESEELELDLKPKEQLNKVKPEVKQPEVELDEMEPEGLTEPDEMEPKGLTEPDETESEKPVNQAEMNKDSNAIPLVLGTFALVLVIVLAAKFLGDADAKMDMDNNKEVTHDTDI